MTFEIVRTPGLYTAVGGYTFEARIKGGPNHVGSISGIPHVGMVVVEVDEGHRNKGIATALVQAFINQLCSDKHPKCVITTTDSNVAMKRVLQKHGFVLALNDDDQVLDEDEEPIQEYVLSF